jgi:ankyrin repeat protein
VALLLKHGADSNKADARRITPLMCAARSSRSGTAACVQVLLEDGALRVQRVSTTAADVSTALHHAVMSYANEDDVQTEREANVAALLAVTIAEKACVSAADTAQMTPLHVACNHSNVNIVQQLLRAGARPEEQDYRGTQAWPQRGPQCVVCPTL